MGTFSQKLGSDVLVNRLAYEICIGLHWVCQIDLPFVEEQILLLPSVGPAMQTKL